LLGGFLAISSWGTGDNANTLTAKIRSTFLQLKEYEGAYTRWVADNDADCPADLHELLKYIGASKRDTKDAWGTDLVMMCGAQVPTDSHFGVVSFGPDKKQNTDDDLHSWDPRPKI